jgi:iron complex transport system substrate-binding protein
MNHLVVATPKLMARFILMLVGICVLVGSSCSRPSAAPSFSANVVSAARVATNVLDGSVSAYDPDADYFPDKVAFRHAQQLKIEYRNHYKLVTFTPNVTGDTLKYVLVQRGAPLPDLPEIHHPLTHVFAVPVERVSLGSMRYGGASDLLGVVDRLNMVSALRSITTPSILQRIKEGQAKEDYSLELFIERDVDALMDYYSAFGESLSQGKMRELGVNTVQMAEHLEPTPLAKSEWLKFFALFFNREKIANEKFDQIELSYHETRALVQEKLARVSYRPKVLVNYRSGGSWQVYGGLNAFAQLIADAGGDYLFKDLPYRHSLYDLPFEYVYDRGAEADVWIVGPDLSSQFADGRPRFDERLRKLKATQNFFVSYNPTKEKRNPWWDQALINPHLELLDYVKALHPELAPEHELKLLRQLK